LQCGLTGEDACGDGGALDGFGVARSGSLHNQLVAQKSAGVHMAATAPTLRAPPPRSLSPRPAKPTCRRLTLAPAELASSDRRAGASRRLPGSRSGTPHPLGTGPQPAATGAANVGSWLVCECMIVGCHAHAMRPSGPNNLPSRSHTHIPVQFRSRGILLPRNRHHHTLARRSRHQPRSSFRSREVSTATSPR
jgi:hypothetical protein